MHMTGRRRPVQVGLHRSSRRPHHLGRHPIARRRIVGRRIRRRAGHRTVRRRGIRRRWPRQRTDRHIVRLAIGRRHHAHRPIGGGTGDDAIDGPDRPRPRIDNDTHENAAMIGGANHVGRAFPARPRQRVVSGLTHDLGDLVRRHEAGQWRRSARRRQRLSVTDENEREQQTQRQRGSAENPCPHGPNPLAPARSNSTT
jgi:hypothetical protein